MNTNGEVTFVNGSGYAPKALSIQLMKTVGYEQMPNFGPFSAVIPGMVDGLRILWEKYGSIEWKKILNLVIESLKNGFPLSYSTVGALNSYREYLMEDEGSKNTYFYASEAYSTGDLFNFRGAIEALKLIADDPREFYEGEIASSIVEYVRSLGGVFSLEDFKKYRAEFGEPLSIKLENGIVVYEMPPNTQSITTL